MWGTLFSAFLMKGENSVGYTLFCLLNEGRKECGVKKGEKSVGWGGTSKCMIESCKSLM